VTFLRFSRRRAIPDFAFRWKEGTFHGSKDFLILVVAQIYVWKAELIESEIYIA
jgi:hypothetical protein